MLVLREFVPLKISIISCRDTKESVCKVKGLRESDSFEVVLAP